MVLRNSLGSLGAQIVPLTMLIKCFYDFTVGLLLQPSLFTPFSVIPPFLSLESFS